MIISNIQYYIYAGIRYIIPADLFLLYPYS